MQKQQKSHWLLCLSLLILGLPRVSGAQESCESVARIISAQGEIRVNRILIDNATASRDQKTVCVGDTISAGELSRAAISILDTETIIRIDQNTELRLTSPPAKDPSFLKLIKGAINILSPAPQSLVVDASFVNAAVEGTEFHIRVEEARAVVTVLQGKVKASNSSGSPVSLTSGQSASAQMGQAPQRDSTIIPKDAIQWALYYPPVIDFQENSSGLTQSDPHFHTRNAARDLSVGALDSARESIAEAAQLDGADEEVWALRLVIALTQNRTTDIEQLLTDTNASELSSAAALIALSYAQQKQFQLQVALETINKAVDTHSQSWLARARRSELALSVGNFDQALTDAKVANDQVANARSKTVLGFALLAQTKIAEAAEAFRQAIALGSEDPLPHLGLGLAKIRSGDLAEGRHDIEIALGIDSQNALVRSYLGKAFYEEKRGPLDEVKFAQAKLQDPNDPTPWFYDAIRKQTINQPIPALEDLQSSIDKNNNRAVYRSKLLLDEDLAARSAALGRIFRDLGLEQRALVEGWRSVNTDPSDFSGHRFLADTYSTLPRHEVARVSELLQSQLLQPLNLAPIQPQLTETNLFVLSGAGPSDVAYNEFNPLFTRDGIGLLVNGVGGGNSTFGGDVVLSGLYGRFSFSAGYFHYQSDGFRENNDQDRDAYNLFMQVALSAKTSIHLDLRSSNSEAGDLALLFDPEIFSPTSRTSEDTDFARIGFHHNFKPGSDLIASVSYSDADSGLQDSFDLPDFGISGTTTIDTDEKGWNAEVQYLFRTERFRFITGFGGLDSDRKDRIQAETQLPFPPFLIQEDNTLDNSISQVNAYIYGLFEQSEELTWTLGLSADFYEAENFERDQINPKLGLTWELNPDTVIRLAAFRTLNKPLIANQTIEPTQVAGFNQFYDGVEGEEAWRYGAAIDHRISSRFFGGLEISKRDLKVPIENFIPGSMPLVEIQRVDWKEQFGRAYLHWTLGPSFIIGLDYLYEKFERNGNIGPEQFVELTTHRLPFSLHYFHSSGFTARLAVSYIDQSGLFGGFLPTAGSDDFFIVDASVSYRLPKRFGIISLDAKNLLDKSFMFQDTDPAYPRIQPGRLVLLKFSLSF